jgi:hypothetical protein
VFGNGGEQPVSLPARTIRVLVPGDVHRGMRMLCAGLGVSAQALVVDLIRSHVERCSREEVSATAEKVG